MKFDFESEAIFIHFLMKRPEYIEHIKSKYFQQRCFSDIFLIIRGYYRKLKNVPSIDTIKRQLHLKKETFTSFWLEHENEYIFEQALFDKFISYANLDLDEFYVEDLLQQFIGHNKFVESVTSMSSIYQMESPNANFNVLGFVEKMRREFNENTLISFDADLGSEWSNIDNHESFVENRFTTGHKFLDKCLNGGYGYGELIVFLGISGGGKSALITDLAANLYKNGKNVLIISLEMSEQIYLRRLSSNLLDIHADVYDEIVKDKIEMKARIDEMIQMNFPITNKGILQVKSFPTGSVSVMDIEAFVNKLIEKIDVQFDAIFVDYLTIVKAGGDDNSYNKYKGVSMDLRAMGERLNSCIIAPVQVNRGGMNKDRLSLSDMGESSGIYHNADDVFAINPRSEYEVQNSEIRLEALKLRNSDSQLTNTQMTYKFIGSKMKFIEMNESNRDEFAKIYHNSNFNSGEMIPLEQQNSQTYYPRPTKSIDDIIVKENKERFENFFED